MLTWTSVIRFAFESNDNLQKGTTDSFKIHRLKWQLVWYIVEESSKLLRLYMFAYGYPCVSKYFPSQMIFLLTSPFILTYNPFNYHIIPEAILCLYKQTKKNKILHKNIERHTAHSVVSWPNPKQWVIVHTSDLMILRQSIYIYIFSQSSQRKWVNWKHTAPLIV